MSYYVLLAIFLAMAVICGWIVASYRQKLRENETKLSQLSARMDQTVESRTAELTRLARHLLAAREQEKARTARELHDELGSSLTAVSMDLAWVRQRLTDPLLLSRLGRAAEVLTATVEMKRRIIQDLRPSMLDNLGLASAIESHAADFAERVGIAIETQLPDEIPPLKEGCPIALFRIFEEALTNAARHAQAKRISVTLSCESDQLSLTVCDDGIGIESSRASQPNPNAHGLLSMRERVQQIGGALDVGTGQDQRGTVVRVTLPCVAATPPP